MYVCVRACVCAWVALSVVGIYVRVSVCTCVRKRTKTKLLSFYFLVIPSFRFRTKLLRRAREMLYGSPPIPVGSVRWYSIFSEKQRSTRLQKRARWCPIFRWKRCVCFAEEANFNCFYNEWKYLKIPFIFLLGIKENIKPIKTNKIKRQLKNGNEIWQRLRKNDNGRHVIVKNTGGKQIKNQATKKFSSESKLISVKCFSYFKSFC